MTRDEAIHRLKLYNNGFSSQMGCFQEVIDVAIHGLDVLGDINIILHEWKDEEHQELTKVHYFDRILEVMNRWCRDGNDKGVVEDGSER